MGYSASVRIPAAIMEAAALRVDQAVDVREEDGRVVIEPIRGPSHDLDELLARMKPALFPEEEDFGPPVGGEVW